MARNDRTIRLEAVKSALMSSRTGVSLKALAERHGWSWRALYRDVEALEKSGYPVIRGEGDGKMRIDAKQPSFAGLPDAEERLALYLAREQARSWGGTSLGKALDRLWHRVSSAGDGQAALLPIESTPWITMRESLSVDYTKHRKVVLALEQATRDRKVLVVRYRANSTGVETDRELEPGQLHWEQTLGALYLVAWCRLRKAVRVFAAHRFVDAKVMAESFAPRAETRSKAALGKAFRIWCDENVYDVKIWFSRAVEGEIRERTWLAEQKIAKAEGGVFLCGRVAGLAEIKRWVLGYGGDAKVVVPQALVDAVAVALRAGAEAYGVLRVPARKAG